MFANWGPLNQYRMIYEFQSFWACTKAFNFLPNIFMSNVALKILKKEEEEKNEH